MDKYVILPEEWIFDNRIKNELQLLLYIKNLANKNGYCNASNQYLAKKLNTNSVRISEKLNKLIRLGYLQSSKEENEFEIKIRYLKVCGNSEFSLRKTVSPVTENRKSNYGNSESSLRNFVKPYPIKGELQVRITSKKEEEKNIKKEIEVLKPEFKLNFDSELLESKNEKIKIIETKSEESNLNLESKNLNSKNENKKNEIKSENLEDDIKDLDSIAHRLTKIGQISTNDIKDDVRVDFKLKSIYDNSRGIKKPIAEITENDEIKEASNRDLVPTSKEIPDWLDVKLLNCFIDNWEEKKKTQFNNMKKELLIDKLVRLNKKYDSNLLLEKATMGGWLDVYEIKDYIRKFERPKDKDDEPMTTEQYQAMVNNPMPPEMMSIYSIDITPIREFNDKCDKENLAKGKGEPLWNPLWSNPIELIP